VTQEQGYSACMLFLKQQGVTPYRCYAQTELTAVDLERFCRGPDSVLPGNATNGWCFSFVLYKEEPNIVTSGGTLSVFVDADSGACGIFAAL